MNTYKWTIEYHIETSRFTVYGYIYVGNKWYPDMGPYETLTLSEALKLIERSESNTSGTQK